MTDQIIRPTFKFIRLGYIAVALLVAAALVAWALGVAPQMPYIAAACAVLFLWPAMRHIRRNFSKLIFTGDKLRYETGALGKSTRTIQLSKVQDVRVDQSFWQRVLGVGDLSIETAGETSRLTVFEVDQPQSIADHIIEASQREQRSQRA